MKRLELALTKAFNATLFNINCMMNDAYLKHPPNPHVHWHLRPRYSHTVVFEGRTFFDKEFGHRFNPEKTRKVRDNLRDDIIARMITYLGT